MTSVFATRKLVFRGWRVNVIYQWCGVSVVKDCHQQKYVKGHFSSHFATVIQCGILLCSCYPSTNYWTLKGFLGQPTLATELRVSLPSATSVCLASIIKMINFCDEDSVVALFGISLPSLNYRSSQWQTCTGIHTSVETVRILIQWCCCGASMPLFAATAHTAQNLLRAPKKLSGMTPKDYSSPVVALLDVCDLVWTSCRVHLPWSCKLPGRMNACLSMGMQRVDVACVSGCSHLVFILFKQACCQWERRGYLIANYPQHSWVEKECGLH